MRLYLQDKTSLVKYNLPKTVDGSLLFTFHSSETNMEYSINIDAIDGKWVLKNNGNVTVSIGLNGSDASQDSESTILEDYKCVPLSLVGTPNLVFVYCLPSVAEENISYSTADFNTITIGSGSKNQIVYSKNSMPECCAYIKLENNVYFIMPATNNTDSFIYVNNQRVVAPVRLYVGDIIFINGLRIIWMNAFFRVSISSSLYSVNGFSPYNAMNINNKSFTPVTEFESNIPLYSNDQFFAHMPRIRNTVEDFYIKVDSPPPSADKESEMPFLLSIGSSFSMLGMTFMSGFSIFNEVYNGTKDFTDCLPQLIMMIITLIGSIIFPFLIKIWTKKFQKRSEAKRVKKFKKYLASKVSELDTIKEKQEQLLRNNFLGYNELVNVINNRTRILWNKLISDDDFLEIRIGLGEKSSQIRVEAAEETFSVDDDALLKAVYEIRDNYHNLKDVPITVNFKNQIVTALVVFNQKIDAFLNWIMFQLLTYHSPLDLKIVVVTTISNSHRWDYLKYSPHCWSDDHTIRYFANNSEDIKSIFQELDAELLLRKETKAAKEKESKDISKEQRAESDLFEPYYFIITDDFQVIRDYKFINDLLQSDYNYGFSMAVVEKNLKNMPKECKKFVVLDENSSVTFSGNINSEDTIHFTADYLSGIDMRLLTHSIDNIPVKGKDAEAQLPTSLSFLQMYSVGKIEQLNIRNRWQTSDPITSLSAPVGVHTNGDLFYLNLHEKFDGPHGLIAGSTGSGKSEFIITYILSMTINYDPREVQFVLIDYKGGGLAGAFENRESGVSIPHLAGTITNLDTSEMNRTLVSIESELKRRQQKFNEYKDKTGESTMDIYKYQRLYREGLIDEPISHLFIISDEFAELKSQQPEFMDQLVSTARIGRSLGVHLILATQKPSGVVNDQIWSNAKFKVCLKVQTKADSMEMLKRPEAASIKETGRFYLQVGYDEYFDIGQSAWSGEKYVPVERIIKKQDNSINFVNCVGSVIKNITDNSKVEVVTEDYGDQLTNIVKYLANISRDDGFVSKKLWLPSLEKTIILNDVLKKYQTSIVGTGLVAAIGEYDAPAIQQQGLLNIDLLDGNLLVYGSPSSGKENLLSTLIHSICIYHSPQEVNFYIGDFGAETLKLFSKYPHVGDVFLTNDTQKIINLVKMLDKELERRKKDYSEFGGNYHDYCKLSGKKDTAIVVVLNNYEVFLETYARMADVFTPLFRDGNKYGIIFVVSTAVSNSIRSKVAQNFTSKVCLKMINDYDYRDLLGAPKGMIPVDNFGRGIFSIDGGEAYEFQTADICNRDDKTNFLRMASNALVKKFPKYKAKSIPVLPEVAYVDDYMYELKGLNCVPIGVERNSLEVYVHDFLENRINLIAATSIKNHIYFVYALIKQMISLPKVQVHIIDVLSIYRGEYSNVDLYTDDFEKAFTMMYNNVSKDASSDVTHVYYILGAAEFKSKVEMKYGKYLPILFKGVQESKNNVCIFFDDSDSYKLLQVEDWYRESINNTFGIWLGEGIDVQVTLGVMSLGVEDRQIMFPCIGYPIYQGKHMIVKYMVDGVDRKDEQ